MKPVLKNVKIISFKQALAVAAFCLIGFMGAPSAYSDEVSDLNAMCASGDHMACHQRDIIKLGAQCNNGNHGACRERDLLVSHDSCNKGDRGACVRFGIILGEDKERRDEWRNSHPDMFVWWEK